MKEPDVDTMPDWQFARFGISLLLNNQIERAEGMFKERPDSTQVKAAYSFLMFMNALMSFEDDKLQLALSELKDTERRCASDAAYQGGSAAGGGGGSGWFRSVRDRLLGNARPDSSGRNTIADQQRQRADRLERQIISADCQLCASLLTFLQQDLAGYMRGAWALRRAWRSYRSTYSQILRLYRETFKEDATAPGSAAACSRQPVSPMNPAWVPNTPNTPGGTSWSLASTPLSAAVSPVVTPANASSLTSTSGAVGGPTKPQESLDTTTTTSTSSSDKRDTVNQTTTIKDGGGGGSAHSIATEVRDDLVNRSMSSIAVETMNTEEKHKDQAVNTSVLSANIQHEQVDRNKLKIAKMREDLAKARDENSIDEEDNQDEDQDGDSEYEDATADGAGSEESAAAAAAAAAGGHRRPSEPFGNNGYIDNSMTNNNNDVNKRLRPKTSEQQQQQQRRRPDTLIAFVVDGDDTVMNSDCREDWDRDRDSHDRAVADRYAVKCLKFHGTDQARVIEAARNGGDGQKHPVDPETLSRLMSAVSFGYGVFQLSVSLLPPNLLRLIHFLGFEGDRGAGLASLMFARQGQDMRAPLATLALLWYHTIVRPFFAVDGINAPADVTEASALITESRQEFAESALFLFFKGRVERLKCDLPAAIDAYQSAVEVSGQPEIQLLCLHEIGWCRLMQRDFTKAHACFDELRRRSRWSRCFYAFLSTLCRGSSGREDEARASKAEILEILAASDHKEAQVEKYIGRRVMCFPNPLAEGMAAPRDALFWRLYLYEMLILWNALSSCRREEVEAIIRECKSGRAEPMVGLTHLVLGACHSVLDQWPEAETAYRQVLRQREGGSGSGHSGQSGPPGVTPSGSYLGRWDNHLSAFTKYELAMVLLRNPEGRDEARRLLTEAQQYHDYDFENRLNVRVHAALKRLNAANNRSVVD